MCADYTAASCADERIPEVAVRDGERVRFHLGFEPRTITLQVGGTSPSEHRLKPMRITEWKAAGETGPATLYSRSEADTAGGDASYVACLQPR